MRGTWEEQIAERLGSLDLEQRFEAAGVEWVEADDDGDVVTRGA